MNQKIFTAFLTLSVTAIPGTLLFWFIFFKDSSNHHGLTPLRLFNACFIPILFLIYGLKKQSIDLSAAISGFICAFLFTIANYGFICSLILFFYFGSKFTKYKSDFKKTFEEDFVKSSKRNWVQVVCNVGVASVLTVLYLIEAGPGEELPLDFKHRTISSSLIVGIIGSFCCAFSDTLASELGSVLSKEDPRLITTFEKVPRGTNGGVSLIGLFLSALGGLLIGLCHYLTIIIFYDHYKYSLNCPQWPLLIISSLSGLFGSIIDSYLGAILQFSGKSKKTGKIVSKPKHDVIKISGFDILNNHTVNLISTFLTAIFSINLSKNIYSNF